MQQLLENAKQMSQIANCYQVERQQTFEIYRDQYTQAIELVKEQRALLKTVQALKNQLNACRKQALQEKRQEARRQREEKRELKKQEKEAKKFRKNNIMLIKATSAPTFVKPREIKFSQKCQRSGMQMLVPTVGFFRVGFDINKYQYNLYISAIIDCKTGQRLIYDNNNRRYLCPNGDYLSDLPQEYVEISSEFNLTLLGFLNLHRLQVFAKTNSNKHTVNITQASIDQNNGNNAHDLTRLIGSNFKGKVLESFTHSLDTIAQASYNPTVREVNRVFQTTINQYTA